MAESSESSTNTGGMLKPALLAVVLAAIVLLVTVVGYQPPTMPEPSSQPAQKLFPEKLSDAEKKAALLARAAEAQSKPLSQAERDEILVVFGGARTDAYNFTQAEREIILSALNAR